MKRIVSFLLITLFLAVQAPVVHAGEGMCGKGKPGMCSGMMKGHGEGRSEGCPVTKKLLMKAGHILANQEELGLTDQQVTQIEQIKTEAEKAQIRKMADFQIFMIDLKTALKADEPDVNAINARIDKESAAMVSSMKETVAAYVQLKKVLTPAQMSTLKGMKKGQTKGMPGKGMGMEGHHR